MKFFGLTFLAAAVISSVIAEECPEGKKTDALKIAQAVGDGPAPPLETTKSNAKAAVLADEDREERPKLVRTGRNSAKRVKVENPKDKGAKVKPSGKGTAEPKKEKPKEEKPKAEKPKEEKPKAETPKEEKPTEDITTKPKEKPATVNDSEASAVDDDTNASGLTSTSSRPEAKQPDGVPGFPLNNNHLKATEPSLEEFPVPDDALVWNKTDLIFDCDAFNKWTTSIRDSASTHPSKHIKIKPGKYFYPLGKRSEEATGDSNLDITRNIQFFAWPESDWTFDLRGVTFMIPSPVGQYFDVWTHTAFYVNQVPGFRILGGTVWFDQGEIYSYATITSLKPSGNNDDTSIGTLKISDGYNVSTWADELVNASSVGIYDVSAWPRSVRPIGDETNLQYMHNWKLNADARTATASFGGPAKVKVGMVITRVSGPNMPVTIDSEVQGGLQVYGMTTNGAFFQIGDNNGGKTATYYNCFEVNPPPRPGFGPRYLGPAMQWGNNFPTYNGPSTPPIEFPGSKWQEYGGSEDLAPLKSQGPPREN